MFMCRRVKVPKRSTSKKIESSGIFPRAKVVRGANWDWGNQDGENSSISNIC